MNTPPIFDEFGLPICVFESRALDQLSRKECKTLFSLAFDYEPADAEFEFTHYGEPFVPQLVLADSKHMLTLFPNGALSAWMHHQDRNQYPAQIHAHRLVQHLMALGVAWGLDPADKPRPSLEETLHQPVVLVPDETCFIGVSPVGIA